MILHLADGTQRQINVAGNQYGVSIDAITLHRHDMVELLSLTPAGVRDWMGVLTSHRFRPTLESLQDQSDSVRAHNLRDTPVYPHAEKDDGK